MGALFPKAFYIDRSQVEWTILTGAHGSDILSRTTYLKLDSIPDIECTTLEYFKEIVVAFTSEERPRELPYIATICAFAITLHKKYNLHVPGLADIIFTELDLPWIITK